MNINNIIHIKPSNKEKYFHEKILSGKNIETFTLDNGGKPFKIKVISQSDTYIYVNVSVDINYNKFEDIPRFVEVMCIEKADAIWYGSGSYNNEFEEKHIGNTILITKGKTCISISNIICIFELKNDEHVVDYVSTVGNSCVPYGFITTTHGIYCLPGSNCVYIPIFINQIVKFPMKYKQYIDYLETYLYVLEENYPDAKIVSGSTYDMRNNLSYFEIKSKMY